MSYPSVVAADSPIGFWHLTDAAAPMANSGSDTTTLATVNGTPGYQDLALLNSDPGKSVNLPTQASLFAGSSVSAYSLGAGGKMVFEAWIKPTATTIAGNRFIASSRSSSAAGDIMLGVFNGSPYFQVSQGSGAVCMNAQGVTVLSAGSIYHIVGVVDLTAPSISIYVNGALDVNSTSKTGTNTSVASTFGVGNRSDVAGSDTNAINAEVGWAAVYTTLSAARVLAHYNAGIAVQATIPAFLGTKATLKSLFSPAGIRRGRSAQGPIAPWSPPPLPTFFFPFQPYRARFVPFLARGRQSRYWVPPVLYGTGFPRQTLRSVQSRLGLGPAPSRRGHQFIPPQGLQQAGRIVIGYASRNLGYVTVRTQPEGLALAAGGAFLPTTEIITPAQDGTYVVYVLTANIFSDPGMFYLITEYYKDGRSKVFKVRVPSNAPITNLLKDVLI